MSSWFLAVFSILLAPENEQRPHAMITMLFTITILLFTMQKKSTGPKLKHEGVRS